MKFSLIIPVYNTEKSIDKTLQSILCQNFNDYEVILVNDGSTDSSGSICEKYAIKNKNIYLIDKNNEGLVSARKTGALFMKGDYVWCVDSDDEIIDGSLNIFSNIIDDYHPDIICFKLFDEKKGTNTNYGQIKEGYYDSKAIYKDIFPVLFCDEKGYSFPGNLASKIIKKEVYLRSQLNVDNSIVLGEDEACSKPCICNSKSLYIIKETLYYYKYNRESITKKSPVFDIMNPIKRFNHYNSIIKNDYDFSQQIYRSIAHSLFNTLCSQFNRDKKYFKNRLIVKKAIEDIYYDTIIQNITYMKSIKMNLVIFVLKSKSIFIMYLYNIYKNRK